MDGHAVQLVGEGVTQPLHVALVAGEGMPHFENPHKRGDLHVQYWVQFPEQLSAEQRALAAKMFPQAAHDEL